MARKKIMTGGFTLVEIMVSLVISSFVVAGIYSVYTIQQRSYKAQEQVAELQQVLRSALDFMTRDIRMAGYDPAGTCGVNKGNYGLRMMESNHFSFEYCDLDDSGQWQLNVVEYSLNGSDLERNLTVNGNGQTRVIAEGVDAIEFQYLQGNSTTAGQSIPPVALSAQATQIVRLSILVRSLYPDQSSDYTDRIQYIPASGTAWPSLSNGFSNPPNDHYYRRLLITSIELRNAL
jgi:type IV pilus assembly protein PilW